MNAAFAWEPFAFGSEESPEKPLARPRNPFAATFEFEATRRTLYFGNLPPLISFEAFLDHVRGGIIEEAKILRDRQCVSQALF